MAKCAVAFPLGILLTAYLLVLIQCAEFEPSVTGGNTRAISNVFDEPSGSLEDSFRTINRRKMTQCISYQPYLQLTVDTAGPLSDVQTVTVTVSGMLNPGVGDFIAVVSPSDLNIDDNALNIIESLETGDLTQLPLLNHYPVKFKLLSSDSNYLSCANSQFFGGLETCSGSVSFRLINIRTDIEFVLFTGGLAFPCILKQTGPLSFANPRSPLYGHLSSIDSSGTSMRLTWVSGDAQSQTVQYRGKTITSTVSTFTAANMCSTGAANDYGWHSPGYIHTAVMTGLSPSTLYSYQYGSQKVGLSPKATFTTPPGGGDNRPVSILVYGDMGKNERDNSTIHFIQPGSLSVIDAVTKAVNRGGIDFVFHIGDISYATGFLVEWDNFLELIHPIASQVSYMTAIGNHERDYIVSGSYYENFDSGGECGVPYETYFQMPTPAMDKPWYSIESGPVHFTIMSTEHDWNVGTEQYNWIRKDLASVNRTKTPWVIYAGHRPFYSSIQPTVIEDFLPPSVDLAYRAAVEPLLFEGQVDLVLSGHVHNYERTCAVYQANCMQYASKNAFGYDTYSFTTTHAPVHAVVGMAGFSLDQFVLFPEAWSEKRLSEFGYAGIEATPNQLTFAFTRADGTLGDVFTIVK